MGHLPIDILVSSVSDVRSTIHGIFGKHKFSLKFKGVYNASYDTDFIEFCSIKYTMTFESV